MTQSIRWLSAVAALCLGLVEAESAFAQRGPAQTPPPAKSATPPPKSAAPQSKAAPPAANAIASQAAKTQAEDDAKKVAILNSPPWRRAMFEFSEWLATQQLYDKQQVEQIKQDFTDRVGDANANELSMILADLEAKFKIMDTQEAQEARAWLAQYLSILSTRRRDDVVNSIPNVATMTSSQLNQEIQRIEARRTKVEQREANAGFQQPVANPFGGSNVATRSYARDHQMSSSNYSSPYTTFSTPGAAPREDRVPPSPIMEYFINPWGNVGLIFNPNRM